MPARPPADPAVRAFAEALAKAVAVGIVAAIRAGRLLPAPGGVAGPRVELLEENQTAAP